MLKIYYGDMKNAVYNTVVYFKNDYDPSWLEDPLVKEMILGIDKSKVLSGGAIDSPGKMNDVAVNLRHMMDFGDEPFEIMFLNDHVIVHTMDELPGAAGRYV